MRRRVITSERGIDFHFFYSKTWSRELHITREHATTPDDAIETYFDGVTEYDPLHRRFVSVTAEHTLFWNWIERGASVYVITCVSAGE